MDKSVMNMENVVKEDTLKMLNEEEDTIKFKTEEILSEQETAPPINEANEEIRFR
jgi:hypothetical protein